MVSEPSNPSESFTNRRKVIGNSEMGQEILELFDEKTKKKLLKSKNLFIRNEEIEIGSATSREGWVLTIVYYITAFKEIFDFSYSITPCPELKMKIFSIKSEEGGRLKVKKQYRLCISVEMKNKKFFLPKVTFSYRWKDKRE